MLHRQFKRFSRCEWCSNLLYNNEKILEIKQEGENVSKKNRKCFLNTKKETTKTSKEMHPKIYLS